MRKSISRVAIVALVIAGAMFSLGARCIEGTSVYVDEDGYTHIVGQFYNETDIQGTAVMLRGTLYDAQDNVLAQKDAPICPPDTQPHSQSMFDIRFDNPGIPPHARYIVQAISGKTLDVALPDPDVVVMATDALGFEGIPDIPGLPVSDGDIFIRFDIRNRAPNDYHGVQGCSIAFDNYG